jgi:hypothetical protein
MANFDDSFLQSLSPLFFFQRICVDSNGVKSISLEILNSEIDVFRVLISGSNSTVKNSNVRERINEKSKFFCVVSLCVVFGN